MAPGGAQGRRLEIWIDRELRTSEPSSAKGRPPVFADLAEDLELSRRGRLLDGARAEDYWCFRALCHGKAPVLSVPGQSLLPLLSLDLAVLGVDNVLLVRLTSAAGPLPRRGGGRPGLLIDGLAKFLQRLVELVHGPA